MIDVKPLSGSRYEVTVNAATPTRHTVTLTPETHARLAGEATSPAELIRMSFEFLLEREPNTSILRSFDLPVIATYFPEYEAEIRKRCERE